MKKNCIRTGILSLMPILLCACATPGNGGMTVQESGSALPEGQPFSVSPATTPEGMVPNTNLEMVTGGVGESNRTELTPDQTAGTQETLPENDFQINGEKETSLVAYRQTVEEGDVGMVFSLINLDGDGIPELVAGDRGNDRYSIYTIKDGTVFCLMDSMATEELAYFESSGVIAAFASWNGGGDEGGYGRQYYQISTDKTLTDGDIPLLSYSYNAVYDGDGIYTGKGITDYFYMGQETDEPVYNEILEMLGITEDSGRLCLENAVLVEEMLDILR